MLIVVFTGGRGGGGGSGSGSDKDSNRDGIIIKYCTGNKSNKLAVCSQFSVISPQIKSHTSSPCSY